MTPEEFRKHGHAVVDWIADYRARVRERPVQYHKQPRPPQPQPTLSG